MKIYDFAQKHRLKVTRDGCQDRIILGRFGHLSEHGRVFFDLVFESLACSNELDRSIKHRRRMAIAVGFDLRQEGDVDAILLFDPSNVEQAKLAIRLVGAKTKRIPSVRQLEILSKAREARRNRKTHCAEGIFAP